MALQVSPEVVGLDKAFATLCADIGSLLGVFLSHVFLQVGVLGEPQSAPATNVGLHALVEQLVAGQVVLVLKLLVADLTLVFPLVVVSDLVPVQRCSLAEIFPTDVTDMRLLTRVDIFMVEKFVGRSEESGADQTLVSLTAVVGQLVGHSVGDGVTALAVKTTVSLPLVASQLGVAWKLPVGLVAVLYIAAVAGGDLGLFD